MLCGINAQSHFFVLKSEKGLYGLKCVSVFSLFISPLRLNVINHKSIKDFCLQTK